MPVREDLLRGIARAIAVLAYGFGFFPLGVGVESGAAGVYLRLGWEPPQHHEARDTGGVALATKWRQRGGLARGLIGQARFVNGGFGRGLAKAADGLPRGG